MATPETTQPTTVREPTQYVQNEHPSLNTSYNARLNQLLVTAMLGRTEPPAAFWGIFESHHFEIQDQQVTGRS